MARRPGDTSSVGSYIYCVGYAEAFGPETPSFDASSVEGRGRPVRALVYGELAAIVSSCSLSRYDVNRENLIAHQRVVEEAMTLSDVLPASFGTIAADDAEVRESLLRRGYDELRRNLEDVRGCVELRLRVLWQRDVLFSEIAAESDEICALRDFLADQPPDTSYHERIRLGELTAIAVEAKRDQEARAILDELAPLAADVQLSQVGSDMVILSSGFLVERSQIPSFDAKVQAIDEAQSDRLAMRYAGPLPPYSFVDLDLGWKG
jgi:hypothetical protein